MSESWTLEKINQLIVKKELSMPNLFTPDTSKFNQIDTYMYPKYDMFSVYFLHMINYKKTVSKGKN
jgi:hypothetical protein